MHELDIYHLLDYSFKLIFFLEVLFLSNFYRTSILYQHVLISIAYTRIINPLISTAYMYI